jgi:hypothetical protein
MGAQRERRQPGGVETVEVTDGAVDDHPLGNLPDHPLLGVWLTHLGLSSGTGIARTIGRSWIMASLAPPCTPGPIRSPGCSV